MHGRVGSYFEGVATIALGNRGAVRATMVNKRAILPGRSLRGSDCDRQSLRQ